MNNTKCFFCRINPRSHSFREITDLTGNAQGIREIHEIVGTTQNIREIHEIVGNVPSIQVFYSRPADAELYMDTVSVVHHFECELSGVRDWEWIFDCAGMGMGHYTQFGLVRDLCQLLKQHGGLRRVKIINSGWLINLTIRCARVIWPELPAISTHPDGN